MFLLSKADGLFRLSVFLCLPIHFSFLIFHYSLFISNYSFLISHYSFLISSSFLSSFFFLLAICNVKTIKICQIESILRKMHYSL